MSGEYLQRNRRAWDRMADSATCFARPATDAECRRPLATLDSRGWLPPSVQGWKVLCLACGGGWQSILYAAAGARVTVVDLSPRMLAIDRREAQRRGFSLRTVETTMDDLGMFAEAEFDLVHHPVSTCYVPDVAAVYREVARVLRVGGLYISQHKQPTSLQVCGRDGLNRYILGVEYYHRGPLPPTADGSYREPGAAEFLHRWESLVGEMCRAGFVIEDLCEPRRADPQAPPGHIGHRGRFIAPYVRIKARRVARSEQSGSPPVWTPGQL